MTTIKRLLDATKAIWRQYNEHPFVKGIEEGSLDKEKFRYYIIQDYLYLQDYVKCFALGVAKAKRLETTRLFSRYITILTDGEMDIHRGYMGKFKVSQEELDITKRALDNLSYTSYMLRIAYEESEVEILVAILACAYSYEMIAKNMVKHNPECVKHPFYGEWIKGYACEEYAKENVILLEMINQLTKNYTEKEIEHLVEIFAACSRYELAFWEMSWNMKESLSPKIN